MVPWLLSDILIVAGAATAVAWHGRGMLLVFKTRSGPFNQMWFPRMWILFLFLLWTFSFGLCMSQVQALLPGSAAEACQAFSFVKDGVLEPWTCILLVLLLKIQWPGTVVIALQWMRGQLQGSFSSALKQFDASTVHLSPAATMWLSMLLLVPSIAFHVTWYKFSLSGSAWDPMAVTYSSPCSATCWGFFLRPLRHLLLAALCYETGRHGHQQEDQKQALHLLLRYVSLLHRAIMGGDLAQWKKEIIFICYFWTVVVFGMSSSWLLVFRPVLQSRSLSMPRKEKKEEVKEAKTASSSQGSRGHADTTLLYHMPLTDIVEGGGKTE
ncbi:hypothetical protein GUITHDRAFT_139161 [Guillardia theta CCMP2712]|uniref:Uncharacterized protein n=1 Tax=Guillardia theta (strain CCMP2712) TaxID=905079 RepID=L1J9N3_GUITC|nr:hypothetical protein GUITHDRAFT_139161 [Guillardia theta CCMP2712]EKX45246.1 hypothetical protein GUITHDRAFT_139161 [Guillardia theta CCMP2712]|eukprot:XP_005832226.1 hypothetical protein GUITHDRAFT_139161 [Guillardia theta CCMP2712]